MGLSENKVSQTPTVYPHFLYQRENLEDFFGYTIFSDKAIFNHPSLDESSTIRAKQRSYVVQTCKIQTIIIRYLLISDIFAWTSWFYHNPESCSLFFCSVFSQKLASKSIKGLGVLESPVARSFSVSYPPPLNPLRGHRQQHRQHWHPLHDLHRMPHSYSIH